jgi:glucose-6-phosphate 1-dehydrogenase
VTIGDAATFTPLRRELGDARRPLHDVANPPQLFPTIVDHLASSGFADGALSSSTNGSDTTSPPAAPLDRTLHNVFAEESIVRSTTS